VKAPHLPAWQRLRVLGGPLRHAKRRRRPGGRTAAFCRSEAVLFGR
jgi:hypothetical protein